MNNMSEIIKKYWLILLILGVAIFGLIVFWATSEKTQRSEQGPQTIPTGVIRPSPTLEPMGYGPFKPGQSTDQITKNVQQLEQNKNDYPLAALLPYTTDLFSIDHYRSPRLLVVIVKSGADEKTAGQLVGGWLIKNGFAADSHQIVWEIVK
jgi:hypothetical protein